MLQESDLGLHCLPMSLLGVARHKRVKAPTGVGLWAGRQGSVRVQMHPNIGRDNLFQNDAFFS